MFSNHSGMNFFLVWNFYVQKFPNKWSVFFFFLQSGFFIYSSTSTASTKGQWSGGSYSYLYHSPLGNMSTFFFATISKQFDPSFRTLCTGCHFILESFCRGRDLDKYLASAKSFFSHYQGKRIILQTSTGFTWKIWIQEVQIKHCYKLHCLWSLPRIWHSFVLDVSSFWYVLATFCNYMDSINIPQLLITLKTRSLSSSKMKKKK